VRRACVKSFLPGRLQPDHSSAAVRGRNDEGARSSKRHVICDRRGVPLAARLTASNRNDSQEALALVDAIPPLHGERSRPRQRPDCVLGDRGYDAAALRRGAASADIVPWLARRRTRHGSGLGRCRWVVERTFGSVSFVRQMSVSVKEQLKWPLNHHRSHQGRNDEPQSFLANCGAGAGHRTRTTLWGHRILSPERLPVPPPRRTPDSTPHAGVTDAEGPAAPRGVLRPGQRAASSSSTP
jgi:transposase